MNDKVLHEAQSYKMSLEPFSFSAAGITESKGSLQQTRSETSSRSHKTRDSEARVSENRSKVSNNSKDSRNLTHICLINLLPLVIRRLFSLCHQVRNGMS